MKMKNQLEMFATIPTSKPDGLMVKLDRPIDRERPCCNNVCIIGSGKGPHAGALYCADCGHYRGWLSKSTAAWIEHVVTRFGAPTTPVVVRKSHTYEEEGHVLHFDDCV